MHCPKGTCPSVPLSPWGTPVAPHSSSGVKHSSCFAAFPSRWDTPRLCFETGKQLLELFMRGSHMVDPHLFQDVLHSTSKFSPPCPVQGLRKASLDRRGLRVLFQIPFVPITY